MRKKLKKIKNFFLYGINKFKAKEGGDEYIQWLSYANAGMLDKGNLYCFEYAVKNIKSDNPALEIGSFCGLSANIIAYYLRKYRKANKLVTVDKWIFEGVEKEKFLKGSDIPRSEYREYIKNSFINNIKMFSGKTPPYGIEMFADDFFRSWEANEIKKDVMGREIKLGGKISFAYIDGNHSYEFAERDFLNVDKYLEKGGFVLFDDSADYSEFECRLVAKEVLKNKKYDLVLKNPNYLFRKR